MCKQRLLNNFHTASISEMAWREDCNLLQEFFNMSDQNNINKVRIMFDLEPLK
jgi:hypothetical protein